MFQIWPDVFLEANLIDPVFDFGEKVVTIKQTTHMME